MDGLDFDREICRDRIRTEELDEMRFTGIRKKIRKLERDYRFYRYLTLVICVSHIITVTWIAL